MNPEFDLGFVASDNNNIDAWNTRLFAALSSTGQVFRYEGPKDEGLQLFFINRSGVRTVINKSEFADMVSTVLNTYVTQRLPSGVEVRNARYIGERAANCAFVSEASQALPPVLRVTVSPMVVPAGGGYRVSDTGYDPRSKLYYLPPEGERPIGPVEGVEHLRTCFSGVPFDSPAYMSNLIGWLLGAITFDPAIEVPFLVVEGNQPGVGKTKTFQSASVILTGNPCGPVAQEPEEYAKCVGSLIRANQKIVFIDNIATAGSRPYNNRELAVHLTTGFSKTARLLGQSRHVSACGLLFSATVNHAKFTNDVSDRVLPVRLFRVRTGPMSPYCYTYALKHRREILGELLWLATTAPVTASGQDLPGFRFKTWLEFVTPRINTYFGPLALEDQLQLDESAQEFAAYGDSLLANDALSPPITAAEFVTELSRDTNKYPGLYERVVAKASSDRSKTTSAGILFRNLKGRPLCPARGRVIMLVDAPKTEDGHSQYQFRLCSNVELPEDAA